MRAKKVLARSAFASRDGSVNVGGAARFATEELARRLQSRVNGAKAALRDYSGSDPAERLSLELAVEEAEHRLTAATDARLLEDTEERIAANRRLLQRLAYDWKPSRKLQEAAYDRVVNLLRCLDKEVAPNPFDADRLEAWRQMHLGPAWMKLAGGIEAAKLRSPHGPLSKTEDSWVLRELDAFERWALGRGHDRFRVQWSIQRILAPFFAHERTGGIERAFGELTREEKKTVVHNAIAVERAWLGAIPAYQRAWKVKQKRAKPIDSSKSWEEIIDEVFDDEAPKHKAKTRVTRMRRGKA